MRGPDRAAIVALLVVQTVFSTLQVVGKVVLAELAPLALAGIRVAIATPLLMLWAWRVDRVLPGRDDLRRLAVLGVLGITANQGLFLVGLSLTSATNAGILMPSIPVFTAAAAALLGIERLGAVRAAGVALAAGGAVVLLDPSRFALDGRGQLGILLILGNCLCYSFFLVLLRPLLARLPWRTVIAWSFLFGGGAMLAVAAPALLGTTWTALSPATVWGAVYIGLGPTAGAFALNTWAVRRSSPATAAAFTTIQPLLTGAMAVAVLGESPRPAQGVGFLLIVVGLGLVVRASTRAAAESQGTKR